MELDSIIIRICALYGVSISDIAKKKHGNTPELTYRDILIRLINNPTVGLELSFPDISRTTISSHLRKLFKDKPNNRELWGTWLLGKLYLKKCPTCGIIKEFSEYHTYTSSPTGLRNICKNCHTNANKLWNTENPDYHKEYNKNHYKLNKPKYQERAKKYYLDHKEFIKSRNNSYRLLNKQKIAETSREYYLNNLLYYREYRKKYYAEHKAEYASYDAKRRATKINATPLWANMQEIKKIYLGRAQDEHVDHIIPLQGELVSGLHCEHNLQYLSVKENLSKGNTFDISTYIHTIEYTPPYVR